MAREAPHLVGLVLVILVLGQLSDICAMVAQVVSPIVIHRRSWDYYLCAMVLKSACEPGIIAFVLNRAMQSGLPRPGREGA